MYVKASTRKTNDGQVVRYLQLAHNEWDAERGVSRTKVLHSFGREDQLDRPGIERLVAALSRLLDPAAAARATATAELAFTDSRPLGGAYLLDALWHRLGIDQAIRAQPAGRKLDPRAERVLFALTANRALAASSKLAATRWISGDVHIAGLEQIDEQSCYRAMDFLLEIEPALAREVFWSTAHLLNLEVDLLFFDTTSTYFQLEDGDEPAERDAHGNLADHNAHGAKSTGFRVFGKSKDHRDDLPQVIVGMAVTRDGIPVRCWCWPGSTADSTLIRQVRDEMRDWNLARVVWVADRGFASEENRRYLQRGGGHYIIGEKLRGGTPAAHAALSRQGRYQKVRENLEVKEVRLDKDIAADRFVVCFNPAEAERDAVARERHLAALAEMIEGSDTLPAGRRGEIKGVISTKPHLRRYLRATPGGLLRIDKAAIDREANLDGKYLLRTSDPKMSPEDIALGYRQLLEVERGWRDMKQIIDLRPVYHRLEQRIRAHVTLCWLALLLIRITENATGRTWRAVREEIQRLHAITFTGPAGTFTQTTEPTKTQRDILTALDLDPPKKVIDLTTH